MSPEAQRIAIAEACGLTIVSDGITHHLTPCGQKTNQCPEGYLLTECPNYLNDLNAMHEAEGVLSCHQFHDYGKHLERVLFSVALTSYSFHDLASFAHATAAQRAEAFLRTLGKWESP